jgi:molybdopterin converting factor subunit 1
MTITIKFFALGRELIGTNALTLELPESATVHDALTSVSAQHPRFAELPSFLVALNTSYAERSAALKHGDELAIIPPVSGG